MANPILPWLEHSALGQYVAHADHLVGASLQIVHVTGLILLLASVALLTLRSLGQGLRAVAPALLVREAQRLLWTGLALIVASGVAIFSSSAVRYAANPAFDLKVLLLGGAVVLQVLAARRLAGSPAVDPVPWDRRALVLGAAALWVATAGAGRAIGYI